MSIRKSSHRFVLAIVVVAALTASASANWGRNWNILEFLGIGEAETQIPVAPQIMGRTALVGPLTGVLNVPGDYATLSDAINDLNLEGVAAGGATINLLAGNPQTAPAGGYAITRVDITASNSISIIGNGNTITAFSPQVTGTAASSFDAIFKLVGADFVTISGFTMAENGGNTVTTPGTTNTMTEFGVLLVHASATDGAHNNTIQNNTISLNNSYTNSVGIFSTSSSSSVNVALDATSTAGTNSNNKIYGNTISNVAQGVLFICPPVTATVFETGNEIGGSTAGTANTITFGNATASSGPWNRSQSTVQAGIYYRNGAGMNIRFNSVTSNSAAYVGSGGLNGIMVSSGTAPTGVTYTTTISDNTVNITSTGVALLTGIDFGHGISTGTVVANNNNVTVNQTSSAANSAVAIGIKANYASATNTANSNTVALNLSSSAGALSGAATGMTLAGVSTTNTANSNNITINQTATGTGTITSTTTALSVAGAATTINALTNTILVNQNTSVATGITTGTITGIAANAVATTVNVTTTNTITVKQAASGAGTYGTNAVTYINVSAASGTINVKNNTLNTTGSTIRSTGAVIGVFQDATVTLHVDIQNNTMIVDRVAASGSITFQSTSGTPSEVKDTISNNNITFTNLAGTSTATGISSLGGPSSPAVNNKTINANTISISGTHTGTTIGITCSFTNTGFIQNNPITITSAAATVTGITTTGTAMTISGNTLSLSSSSTAPTAMTGINESGSGAHSITNNTFSAMNFSGIITTSPTVSGIAISGGTIANVFSNTITNISIGAATSTGGPTVDGILISGGSGINVVKNRIHGLITAGSGTSTAISGIRISAGGATNANNIYNNLIGSFSAPAASSISAQRGINITSTSTTTNHNVFYNTVGLFGSSTGVNYGGAALFHAGSSSATTSNLNLRNNILVSVLAASGTGASAAYQRSGAAGTLANYANSSNNNLFYAGTPSSLNLIYYDGSNAIQTLAAYKTGVPVTGTIAPRDSVSISEDPEFQSTVGANANFLKYRTDVGKQIESGAVNIGGITDDFVGTIRQGNGGYGGTGTAPDIGAWELEGIGIDLNPPNIAYTAFGNTASPGNRLITVTITDATGVNQTATFLPRIYFKKSTTPTFSFASSTQCVSTGGTPINGTYDCTIDNSLIGGVSTGDIVEYFVIAQDTAGPYVGSNPAGVVATDVNTVTTAPTPNSYTILPSIGGAKTVGTGAGCPGGAGTCDYGTLTAAIAAVNAAVITSPVTLSLTDAAYNAGTGETIPLPAINVNGGSSATNTVTIKPAVGVSPTISGSAASACLIRLNGADYVTIDGSNTVGGTTRDLTLTNTSTTSPATVCVISQGTGAGATNDTIKNTNISTGSNAATSYGIWVGSATIGTAGDDNDSLTILNNAISKSYYGIRADANSTGVNNNLIVTGNSVGGSGVSSIGFSALTVTQASTATISQNDFFGITTTSSFDGVSIGSGVTGSTFTRNIVRDLINNGTNRATGVGIAAGSASGNTFSNNFIYSVTNNGTGGNSFAASGFNVSAGGGYNFYFNSVNLSGDRDAVAATKPTSISAAMFVSGASITGLDIRNNIFANTQTAATNAPKSYSIYSSSANTAFTSINYNDYHVAGTQGVLGFLTTDRTNLAGIQTGFGQNANSVSGNPQFLSDTNLHISTALTTPVESAGTPIVGITTDIDGIDIRNGTTPDIGADEGTFIAPVTNDMQATAFIDPTDASSKLENTAFAPQASFTNNGTATQTSVPVRYRICTDGTCTTELYNDLGSIASIASGVTITVTFANIPAGLPAATYTIKAKAELIGDTVTGNDEITGTLNVLAPLNGTYTVGSGGNYPSLTNNGGIFQALNALGISGQVFINITSNLTGETGTHQLNDITAGNNLTIRPVGGPWTITGSSAGSLVVINGADNVVIDGSGTDANAGPTVGGDSSLRNLTITNTNTGTSSAVVSIHTGTNGATNNTIKNLNVVGSSSTAGTLIGIEISGNTVGSLGADNDNNRITNCSVQKSLFGIVALGASAANQNSQNFINRNDLSATGANSIGQIGIYAANVDNLQVQDNSVGGINNALAGDSIGIAVGTFAISTSSAGSGGISNGTIYRNRVNGVASTNATGYSAVGIVTACTTCDLNNNMITGVISPATSPDFPAGIFVVSGAGTSTNVFHNSVSMTGDRGAVASQMPGYAIAITGADTPVGMINNILFTSQTASGGGVNAKSYALGVVTSNINFTAEGNNYWSVGANDGGIRVGSLASAAGTDYATLGAFQVATGKDNAVPGQEVDPQFANPANDLHLTNPAANTLLNAGYNNQWPPVDFDNDPRPTTAPPQTNLPHADIGADEVVQADAGVIPNGTFYNAVFADGNTATGNVTVTGTAYLTGESSIGGTLTLGCNATVVGAGGGNYVVGSVQKDFCSTGTFTFPVGTESNGTLLGTPPEYTPMTANITAGTFPSSLTVHVVDDFLPGLVQSSAVSRYWTVTETGNLTADMEFTYIDPTDVNGNEANYKVFRHIGGVTTEITPNSNNPAGNTATVLNVSNFSDWGIGALVPTASEASISGRVTTGGGAGIKNAAIVVTGNSLSRPIIVKTGSFGYYMVEGLQAGETYVVTVVSKRFTFQVPSRIISLTDSVTDVDFVANPEQ